MDRFTKIIFFIILFFTSSSAYSFNTEPCFYFIGQAESNIEKYYNILKNPKVCGVTFYISWERLQPKENHFDFSIIDRWVKLAKDHSKKINIGVFTGIHSPSWVKNKVDNFKFRRHLNPTQKSSGIDQFAASPLPTDSSLIALLDTLIMKLASKYDKEQSVGYIAITGPNLTGFTTNITIPNPIDQNDLFSKGFSKGSYLKAWKDTIDIYAKNFQNKNLVIGIGPVLNWQDINKEIVEYGYDVIGNRFGVMVDFLNSKWMLKRGAKIKELMDIMENDFNSFSKGYQMIWYSDKSGLTGNLCMSIDIARQLNADWVEIWKNDFNNFLACFQPYN